MHDHAQLSIVVVCLTLGGLAGCSPDGKLGDPPTETETETETSTQGDGDGDGDGDGG